MVMGAWSRRDLLRTGLEVAGLALMAACGARSGEGAAGSATPEELATRSQPLAGQTATPDTLQPTATPIAVPSPTPSSEPTAEPKPTYPPFEYPSQVRITPIEEFYSYTYHPQPPPDMSGFRLRIWGEVKNELELSLDDLTAMPIIEQMHTLECISNPVGGSLIGNAVWRGVPMTHLLALADVTSRAIELKFECGDGYSTSIPVQLATDPDSFLAHWMNGVPLPAKHGSPLRGLWPGRYGQKQPKWITGIELVSQPYLGHWERQGWSNDAIVQPNSRIEQPEKRDVVTLPTVVSGIAFADRSGVAKVEVSTDDGVTWSDADLLHGPSSLAWTEWRHEWTDAEPGSYVIRARVTDGEGHRQRFGSGHLLGGVKPDGTDLQHTVAVTVKQG
jgi:DMSO/TMAO reductase YedYZ molybdopterin-dependent catalytic subunit